MTSFYHAMLYCEQINIYPLFCFVLSFFPHCIFPILSNWRFCGKLFTLGLFVKTPRADGDNRAL